MKIIDIKPLAIPEIKVIKYGRFSDMRGYFTETFRKSDFLNQHLAITAQDSSFAQCNESYSKKGTVRGLHFQWNPYMGKLVRTIYGHMVDLILDIRLDSPSFGKIIAYDMPSNNEQDYGEWIWVPPGFAHGNFFLADSAIEYMCTGEYSQGCEAGVSPLASDLNWDLCAPELARQFSELKTSELLITDKDRNGFSLASWRNDSRSQNFIYGKL